MSDLNNLIRLIEMGVDIKSRDLISLLPEEEEMQIASLMYALNEVGLKAAAKLVLALRDEVLNFDCTAECEDRAQEEGEVKP